MSLNKKWVPWIWSGVIVFFVAPLLWSRDPATVFRTYIWAAESLGSQEIIYSQPPPKTDWFKYSPFFALCFSFFTFFPQKIAVILCASFNSLLFGWGMWRFFQANLSKVKSAWLFIFLLFAASMELNGSLLYHQVNPAILGLILLGVASFRDGQYRASAFFLALGLNWKILPGIFAFFLVLMKPALLLPGLGFSFLFFLIPAFFVGWQENLSLHGAWLELLSRDLGRSGLLDLRSTFNRLIGAGVGDVLRYWVIVGTLTTSVLAVLSFKKNIREFPWSRWTLFLLAALLLLSTGTESPTFVLLAPMLLLWPELRKGERVLWIGFWVALSFLYSDLWPKSFMPGRPHYYIFKPLATCWLWMYLWGNLKLRFVRDWVSLPK